MKKLCLLSLIAIPFLAVRSQEPVSAGFEHWAPAPIETMSRALATEAAAALHHVAVKQLSDYPNEAFLLVHRGADGSPELHETQGNSRLEMSSEFPPACRTNSF
jgi:hypothetical protein